MSKTQLKKRRDLLLQIIQKIIDNPTEKKFRKIKLGANYIKQNLKEEDKNLLCKIGFVETKHEKHGKLLVLEDTFDNALFEKIGQTLKESTKLNHLNINQTIDEHMEQKLKISEGDNGIVYIETNPSTTTMTQTTAPKYQIKNKQEAIQEYEENQKEGVITGEDGFTLLKRSKLDTNTLAIIWKLVDRTEKGYLTKWEYVMAKEMIGRCQNQKDYHLPDSINEELSYWEEQDTNQNTNHNTNHNTNDDKKKKTKKEEKEDSVLKYTKLQLDNMEADVTCAVCYDTYRDPHKLPCGHCYCKECIQEISDYYKDVDGVSCPKCKKVCPRNSEVYDEDTAKMVRRVLDILDKVHNIEIQQGKSLITYSSLDSSSSYTGMKRSPSEMTISEMESNTLTKKIDYIPFNQIFILRHSDTIKSGTVNATHIQKCAKCKLDLPSSPTQPDSEECVITITAQNAEQLHMAEAMIFDCISSFNSDNIIRNDSQHTYSQYRRIIDDIPKCFHEDLNKKGRDYLDRIQEATKTKIEFFAETGTLEIYGSNETNVADAGRMIHIIYENLQNDLEKSTMAPSATFASQYQTTNLAGHVPTTPVMNSSGYPPVSSSVALPSYCQERFDRRTNRVYYVDHKHKFTCWYHPSTEKYRQKLAQHLQQQEAQNMSSSSSTHHSSHQNNNECVIM